MSSGAGPQAAPAAQQAPAGSNKGSAQQPQAQVQATAAAAAQVGQALPAHAPWAWAGEEVDHVRALLRALHGHCIQHKARGWTFLERAACNLRWVLETLLSDGCFLLSSAQLPGAAWVHA